MLAVMVGGIDRESNENEKRILSGEGDGRGTGDVPMNSVKIVVGAEVDTSVTHTRVVTSTTLGIFASKLPEGSLKYVIDPLWSSLTSLSGVQRQVCIRIQ